MNRRRPHRITFRCNEQELQLIKQQVKESGMKEQQFIIESLINQRIYNTDGIKTMLPELRGISTNINQIARKINKGDKLTYDMVEIMEKEVKTVWRLLNQLIKDLRSQES